MKLRYVDGDGMNVIYDKRGGTLSYPNTKYVRGFTDSNGKQLGKYQVVSTKKSILCASFDTIEDAKNYIKSFRNIDGFGELYLFETLFIGKS